MYVSIFSTLCRQACFDKFRSAILYIGANMHRFCKISNDTLCRVQLTLTSFFRVNRNGTCYSATECSDNGGKASGNCASGFGVCCLFVLSSTSKLTVKENNTYIQNPSFPSVYSETSALTYTINKCKASKLCIWLDYS